MDVKAKLLSRYKVVGECWEYTGSIAQDGYGHLYHEGRGRLVHRISYSLFVDPIPKGLHVLHKCDNRACINPQHLFLGTDKDNMDDMYAKGRNRHHSGSSNATAKFNESDIVDIRDLLDKGYTHADIAATYGVDRSTITAINRRKNWKHV